MTRRKNEDRIIYTVKVLLLSLKYNALRNRFQKLVEFSSKYNFADGKTLQAYTQHVKMFHPILTWPASSLQFLSYQFSSLSQSQQIVIRGVKYLLL